eukprot:TCONS_00066584-protein
MSESSNKDGEEDRNPLYNFECQLHPTNSFKNLNKYRQNGTLCDVTIKVKEELFHVHKVVLSSASNYFQAMFTSGLREGTAELVELHEADPMSISILLDFIYTSKIEIVNENVQRLLPASKLFQLDTVTDACCNFLQQQLDPCNALGILMFAEDHSCQQLVNHTATYVMQNFLQIVCMEEFLTLSFERMKFFLSSDTLMIGEEEDAYNAVIRWIKSDSGNRKKYLHDLMNCVRLPLLRRDFLMLTVEPEELIKQDSKCKDLLIEAMKYHLMPEMRRYLQKKRTKYRCSEGTEPLFFVVGGQSLFSYHSDCEIYCPNTERWYSIQPMTMRRSRVGIGVVYDKLYVVGGFDGSQDLASVEVCNGNTKQWSSGLQMGTQRSCLGVAVLHNLLYAIGGFDGSSCLKSMERFDPLSNQWMSVAMMHHKRRYISVGVINEFLIVAGGYDGNEHLKSCETYDPVSNIWTKRANMAYNRSSAGSCVLNGMFYVSGGTDGTLINHSCEKYDIQNDEWTTINSMLSVRMTHMLVTDSKNLFAIGGNDGSGSLNSVEQYSPEKDEWIAKKPASLRRSHLGAAVMYTHLPVPPVLKDIADLDLSTDSV